MFLNCPNQSNDMQQYRCFFAVMQWLDHQVLEGLKSAIRPKEKQMALARAWELGM